MQPSSLVFLAIIVAWAAYLLPQWIRRRDAMGQAPGRDRYSGGLRVLRPRLRPSRGRSTVPLLGSRDAHDGSEPDAVIRPDSSQPATRRAAAGRREAGCPEAGYPVIESVGSSAGSEAAVSSAGASGSVGGSAGGSAGGSVGGSVGRAVGGSAGGSVGSAAGGSARGSVGSAAGPPAGVAGGGGTPPRGDRRRPERAPVTPRARAAAGRAAAVRRVRVLAVLLLLSLVSWLAAAGSLLQPVVPAAVTALLIADVIALRAVARRRQALRRQQARATHPAGRTTGAPSSGAGGQAGVVGGLPVEHSATTGARRSAVLASRAPLRRTLPPASAVRRPAVRRPAGYEDPAVETDLPTTAEAEAPTSDGTWMPVPVPPPTYTLKPMAPRPEPRALELDGDRPTGPAGPGGVTDGAGVAGACAAGAGGPGALVLGSDGTSPPAPPTGPVPDRSEGGEPPAAQERPARRPWEEDREWADEIDLDAVLARRRAVNG